MSRYTAEQISKLDAAAVAQRSKVHIENVIKDLIETALSALAASGGNAAPGLTLEKINELAAKHIQEICGVGRPPAPMGENHEFVILCRAIEAASAPNAALVAAAQSVVIAFNDKHTSLAQVARWINELKDALSAAGQEVGHG